MTLRSTLRALSERTERAVLALWEQHLDGRMTEEQFVDAAAITIATADARAVTAADFATALELGRMLGEPVGPVGLEFDGEGNRLRLTTALATVLAASVLYEGAELVESQSDRLGRLARSEPLSAGQAARQNALRGHDVGWTRATGGEPCPLCAEWADGVVRPASIRMATHANCSCVQQPVRA